MVLQSTASATGRTVRVGVDCENTGEIATDEDGVTAFGAFGCVVAGSGRFAGLAGGIKKQHPTVSCEALV